MKRATSRKLAKHLTDEVVARFWPKVDVRGANECWPWLAGKVPFGYGTFHVLMGMRQFSAHVVSYVIANGDVPDGLWVLHHCDNPACCNPKHLYAGSDVQNVADKVARGRVRKGIDMHLAKLTERDVTEIRKRLAVGRETQRQIGKDYGVSDVIVSLISRNKIWKHVP